MFGLRLSLAVLGTALVLGSTASEAEARHCRHQRHHRHHEQRGCCDQGYSQGHHQSGYEYSGQNNSGCGVQHHGHHGQHGNAGQYCGTVSWQQGGGYQNTEVYGSSAAVVSPAVTGVPAVTAPPQPAISQVVAPTPGI
jgi:hypothetical protein